MEQQEDGHRGGQNHYFYTNALDFIQIYKRLAFWGLENKKSPFVWTVMGKVKSSQNPQERKGRKRVADKNTGF